MRLSSGSRVIKQKSSAKTRISSIQASGDDDVRGASGATCQNLRAVPDVHGMASMVVRPCEVDVAALPGPNVSCFGYKWEGNSCWLDTSLQIMWYMPLIGILEAVNTCIKACSYEQLIARFILQMVVARYDLQTSNTMKKDSKLRQDTITGNRDEIRTMLYAQKKGMSGVFGGAFNATVSRSALFKVLWISLTSGILTPCIGLAKKRAVTRLLVI